MRHPIEVRDRVTRLRHSGMSIPDIVRETGLSKTTIWHYVHLIKLPNEMMNKIRSRQGGSTIRFNKALENAQQRANEILEVKQQKDLCIAISMLYWAEGSKREFVFTNTDTEMIVLYLHFLRLVLKVNPVDIQMLIRISDEVDSEKILSHWENVTKLSKKCIRLNVSHIYNSSKSKYGICRVSVRKSSFYLKIIQCMIQDIKHSV